MASTHQTLERGVKVLGGLAADQLHRLSDFLRVQPASVSFHDLASNLPKYGVSISDAPAVLFTLAVIHNARRTKSIAEVTQDVLRSLNLNVKNGQEVEVKEAVVNFWKQLDQVVNESTWVATAADVQSLSIQQERIFRSVSIYTDLRPVVKKEVPGEFVAAAIVHQLNLKYWSEAMEKELFVSLNGQDLRLLRDALDAAIAKRETLEKKLEQANIWTIPDL